MTDRTNYRLASSRSEGNKLFKAMVNQACRAAMFAGEGNEQAFSYSMQELTFLASDMRELRQAEKEREMFA